MKKILCSWVFLWLQIGALEEQLGAEKLARDVTGRELEQLREEKYVHRFNHSIMYYFHTYRALISVSLLRKL